MSEQDPQIWQDVMQVNVNATFMLTQALLPLLLKSDAARWSLRHQALAVRDAPTGAPMPPRSLLLKE
ncbi:oxidoreductase [Salmonella enterica subsp. enterica]|uniref:Oxidoreductase n=1 Tax=Salmonella enterica I TaxID=59201 RepID=A0A379W8B8_SALET|nr:oxidoreductase [Salmonella enterica subsp. enterica]